MCWCNVRLVLKKDGVFAYIVGVFFHFIVCGEI